MAGRICRIFPGTSLDQIFEWTRDQLKAFYGESFRQEARQKLFWIEIFRLANAGESAKGAIQSIEIQANPPDPEADGDMDKEKLRDALKQFKRLGVL